MVRVMKKISFGEVTHCSGFLKEGCTKKVFFCKDKAGGRIGDSHRSMACSSDYVFMPLPLLLEKVI